MLNIECDCKKKIVNRTDNKAFLIPNNIPGMFLFSSKSWSAVT